MPNSTGFDTVNFSQIADLRGINFWINSSGKRRIVFNEKVNLIDTNDSGCFIQQRINLSDVFQITDTKIITNISKAKMLNNSATLYFYGSFTQPKVLHD